MLFIYFWLGVALSVPELALVMRFPKLYQLMKKDQVFEVFFSLILGALVGTFMGVGPGMTFAVGNVFGTMITKAIYSMHLIEACRFAKKSAINTAASVQKTWSELQEVVHLVWLVITFPFRVAMAILRGINSVLTFLSEQKAQLVGK